MRGKVVALLCAFAMVTGFAFASGSSESSSQTAASTNTGPQYGGTLTMLNSFSNAPPPNWDPTQAAGPQIIVWSNPVMEQAIIGDINKYGPAGEKKYGFTNGSFVPTTYYKGELVTSWEWKDPLTLVFHVRHGVHFSGISANPGVMKPRELTAEDFVYQMEKMMKSPNKGPNWTSWVASTNAPDKYTWVIHLKKYYSAWRWWVSSAFMQIFPKEVYQAGASDWRNLVGTGPFTLSDFVRGSYAIYKKNPNYWGTITINGKTYKEPFIDKLVWPIIPDQASQIAALRTGKVDWDTNVSPRYVSTLKKTSPDLVRYPYFEPGTLELFLQSKTSKYFQNESVRRAMFIGTDLNTIGNDVWGEGNYTINPLKGTSLYMPIADMPASTKELFNYDPAKAKQMLAKAGYPNGFTMQMTYAPSDVSGQSQDIASLVVAQWAKLGVNVKLHSVERSVMPNFRYGHHYTDSLLTEQGGLFAAPISLEMGLAGNEGDTGEWNDPWFNNAFQQILSERDASKALALEKQMVLKFLDGASMIPTPLHAKEDYVWPWVKNYHGEISAGYFNFNPMLKQLWIDQALKKKLGH